MATLNRLGGLCSRLRMGATDNDLTALKIAIFLVISKRLIASKRITIRIVIAANSTNLVLSVLATACIIPLDDLSLIVGRGAKIANLATIAFVYLQVVNWGQNL